MINYGFIDQELRSPKGLTTFGNKYEFISNFCQVLWHN
jgi:hypothetical protein